MRGELVAGQLLRPGDARPVVLRWSAQDLTTTQPQINASAQPIPARPTTRKTECMSGLRHQKLEVKIAEIWTNTPKYDFLKLKFVFLQNFEVNCKKYEKAL